ncbi:MAG: ABC transporter ATP-binding protein [Desulfobulbaceae bacterium]|nr:MAG: ABC transporter ATP-binding protein [Desulfobulbaceae bacterium]
MKDILISGRRLTKSFQSEDKEVTVLNDIFIDVYKGEFLAIVGRSGSGKTTLLNVMSTLVRPDDGDLFYQGKNLLTQQPSELNLLRKTDFAIVFQFHHLIPYLTVMQNTLLPYMHSIKPVSKDLIQRAGHYLTKIGLGDKLNRLPGKLSGGEQQRVAIARAVVKSSGVLFADEPTGSLDKKTGEEIMDFLQQLNHEGMSIVMVTHEPAYAARADRVIELSDGALATPPLSPLHFTEVEEMVA